MAEQNLGVIATVTLIQQLNGHTAGTAVLELEDVQEICAELQRRGKLPTRFQSLVLSEVSGDPTDTTFEDQPTVYLPTKEFKPDPKPVGKRGRPALTPTAEKSAKQPKEPKAPKVPKEKKVREPKVTAREHYTNERQIEVYDLVEFKGAPNNPNFPNQMVQGEVYGAFFHAPDVKAGVPNPARYLRIKTDNGNVMKREYACRLIGTVEHVIGAEKEPKATSGKRGRPAKPVVEGETKVEKPVKNRRPQIPPAQDAAHGLSFPEPELPFTEAGEEIDGGAV